MAIKSLALACLLVAAFAANDAAAQSTSGTPSGGNCRPFNYHLTIRGAAANGTASTPHTGSPVVWTVSGAVSGQRVILLVESTDKRLRNPSTRWRGELRDGALQLEQTGSRACDPTRAGALKKT